MYYPNVNVVEEADGKVVGYLTGRDYASKLDAVRLSRIDTIGSLTLALLVNAAILILAAAAFHQTGHSDIVEIQDAYRMLDPLVGGAMASVLFGVALLASGQSSTFTGTIAFIVNKKLLHGSEVPTKC